jgi:hypothetical protein
MLLSNVPMADTILPPGPNGNLAPQPGILMGTMMFGEFVADFRLKFPMTGSHPPACLQSPLERMLRIEIVQDDDISSLVITDKNKVMSRQPRPRQCPQTLPFGGTTR